MRNLVIIAALAAMASAAAATPTTAHRHHAARADNGSVAVRELNQKSLQQAEAGAPAATPGSPATMSDSGAAAQPAPPAGAPPVDTPPASPSTPQ